MKKITLSYFLTAVFFLLFSLSAFAQKFASHPVKKGETLQSISRQYNVPMQSILNLNKEIKNAEALQPNTILIIPLDAKATVTEDVKVEKKGDKVLVVEKEPSGFTTYKVKRKDNLFRLAETFNISQNDIKKYNPELYSTELKKGMTLKIPKYKKTVIVEKALDKDAFEQYTVLPKETRWSVANKYGITIDSLLALNPALSQENAYLAAGQKLRLPKLPGSTTKNQTSQLYDSYTVPPKKGFLAIEREFGVTEEELKTLNPELNNGGLKEGMIIRIPQKKKSTTVVNTENYIFYEVQPGEAEYGLTRKLGLSYRELLDLNPELKAGLKAGMVLKLPKNSTGDFDVKNSLVIESVNLTKLINTNREPNLVIMLPFRLDLIDVNNKETASELIGNRKDANYSLGLYSGALVAIDSLKKLGLKVNVSVLDTEKSLERTKEILLKPELKKADAIIGPLDSQSLQEVATRMVQYQVPVIASLPAKSEISLNNLFYSVPTDENLRNSIISYVKENRTKENIIVIADDAHKVIKELIVNEFPKAKSLQLVEKYAMKDKIIAMLSSTQENWVFLEADQFNTVNSVISVLNASTTSTIKIRLFTTNKGKAYEDKNISNSHLNNLSFTFPSVEGEEKNDAFVSNYKKMFSGKSPDKFAFRGFDITMDVLLKLAYKENLFDASKFVAETKYSANKFNYIRIGETGYYNAACYIMSYQNMYIKQAE